MPQTRQAAIIHAPPTQRKSARRVWPVFGGGRPPHPQRQDARLRGGAGAALGAVAAFGAGATFESRMAVRPEGPAAFSRGVSEASPRKANPKTQSPGGAAESARQDAAQTFCRPAGAHVLIGPGPGVPFSHPRLKSAGPSGLEEETAFEEETAAMFGAGARGRFRGPWALLVRKSEIPPPPAGPTRRERRPDILLTRQARNITRI